MKVAYINSVNFGSTGNIVLQLADLVRDNNGEAIVCCANSRSNRRKQVQDEYLIGNRLFLNLNRKFFELLGRDSFLQKVATHGLIKRLKEFGPDIIHLHNLHGWYVELFDLFRYIKKNNIKVVWTLHDCWALTGHCTHFDLIGCNKWQSKCENCPQYHEYPATKYDYAKRLYQKKKKSFADIPNMTIVTPSAWLAAQVKKSFLAHYPVKVIHNGIDLSVFKPTQSEFRQQYKCENKYVLLGVSFAWGTKKGLDVFIELAKRLPSDYQIVLVGVDEQTSALLPQNIIAIPRTKNQDELAQIYSAADLFVNPTREDTFPTVNMEAIACGTPVLTFKTGGSPEIIDEGCGAVVPKNDMDAMLQEVVRITQTNCYQAQDCLSRAAEFDAAKRFREYMDLYSELTGLSSGV